MVKNVDGMVKDVFTLGVTDELQLDGIHHPDDKWNGWATPFLTLDSVLKVEAWIAELVKNGEIEESDGPSVVDGEVFWNDGDGGREAVSPTFFEGFTFMDDEDGECFEAFYDVGRCGWTYEVGEK